MLSSIAPFTFMISFFLLSSIAPFTFMIFYLFFLMEIYVENNF